MGSYGEETGQVTSFFSTPWQSGMPPGQSDIPFYNVEFWVQSHGDIKKSFIAADFYCSVGSDLAIMFRDSDAYSYLSYGFLFVF